MELKKLLQQYASATRNGGRVKSLSDFKGTPRKRASKDVGVNNSHRQKNGKGKPP